MVEIVKTIEEANCITHSGTMHADEVFTTALLELYLGDLKVFRTSQIDAKNVSSDIWLYDIGRGKFDHHQEDALKRENGIPYAAFGLVWKEIGKDFLTKNNYMNIDEMFIGIDKDFVEGIDADDNGVFPRIEASYKVKTVSNIIKLFNPGFQSSQNESDQFLKAVDVAKKILEEEILSVYGKVIALEKVRKLLEKNNGTNKYLLLDEYLPYEEAVLTDPLGENILFVAYPSNRGGYAIKTIPKSIDDKTSRCLFPLEWAGKDEDELKEVSNIEGLRFCHLGRFIVTCDNINAVYQVLDKLCNDIQKEN